MGAQLTEQTRGCRTTELFWEGQERLTGREAEFPLRPGAYSRPPVLPPWPTGRRQSHGCLQVGAHPPHTVICCSKWCGGRAAPLGLFPTLAQRGLEAGATSTAADGRVGLQGSPCTGGGLSHPTLHSGMAVGMERPLELPVLPVHPTDWEQVTCPWGQTELVSDLCSSTLAWLDLTPCPWV